MRTKDENKIKAIKDAVIKLCAADGFTNLTTAKVAKTAGVSPATIYLYYKDKTDMLSRLYEEVKGELQMGVAGVIAGAGADTEAQLRAMLHFTVTQYLAKPLASHFVSALWTNQELLDDQARAFGSTESGALFKLYERIQADPAFIDAPDMVVGTLASLPTVLLQTASDDINDAMINQTIELVVKALRA